MVALCVQCGAPLTPADLGYTCCLNCHWQQVFDYADDPARAGELRLRLHRAASDSPDQARDSGNRTWQRVTGDGAVWCILCGQPVAAGWVQGQPGWLQCHVCAEHVDLSALPPPSRSPSSWSS